ncbi:unnamed protein product [Euphydryas editha]|uniref:Uncharacterized protein n=1 Tax=Euphydryas editha TaxID=104508 RepID=A0AAU9U465_EUPED|nr:unnamed protein product [Euphydryas editha]
MNFASSNLENIPSLKAFQTKSDMKRAVRNVFFGWMIKVLRSYLSGTNKARAYNGWVMPTLLYTFGVLRWTEIELDALDRIVRMIKTRHHMRHPKSSVMRLNIPWKFGGLGLLITTPPIATDAI